MVRLTPLLMGINPRNPPNLSTRRILRPGQFFVTLISFYSILGAVTVLGAKDGDRFDRFRGRSAMHGTLKDGEAPSYGGRYWDFNMNSKSKWS